MRFFLKSLALGDCYRTIDTTFKIKFQSLFMPIVGAMAIAPYGFKSLSARFLFMPTLINGALENSTLRNLFKIQQTMSVKSENQKSQSLTDQFNPTTKRVP